MHIFTVLTYCHAKTFIYWYRVDGRLIMYHSLCFTDHENTERRFPCLSGAQYFWRAMPLYCCFRNQRYAERNCQLFVDDHRDHCFRAILSWKQVRQAVTLILPGHHMPFAYNRPNALYRLACHFRGTNKSKRHQPAQR